MTRAATGADPRSRSSSGGRVNCAVGDDHAGCEPGCQGPAAGPGSGDRRAGHGAAVESFAERIERGDFDPFGLRAGASVWTLSAIVAAALEANRAELEAARGHGWRSASFGLVRALRHAPGFRGLTGDEAACLVEHAFGELRPDLEPSGAWEALVGCEDSAGRPGPEPLEEFIIAWDRGLGGGGFAAAAATVAANPPRPDEFGPDLSAPRRAKFRAFLALCRELQRATPGGPFAVPVELVAEALGTDPKTSALWRSEAVRRGWLELAAAAHWQSRRAAEFRFKQNTL